MPPQFHATKNAEHHQPKLFTVVYYKIDIHPLAPPQWPSAPATSFAAIGYGLNTIWVDPEHDLVVVWRWHEEGSDELFKRILASVKTSAN
jgi:hypothetical protein